MSPTLLPLLAGLAKVLLFVAIEQRRRNLRIAIDTLGTTVLIALLVSSAWLMIVPTGDQPILALVESATGIGPTRFLDAGERDAYESAARDAVRFQREVDRLNELEKAARYQGAPLSDDEVRRIASYQKTFNEMTRGERFVQETLRGKAQTRARWIVGVPGMLVARGTAVAHAPALEGFSCRHRLR
jgi:zinc/manganese transport system permease protein